LGVRFEVHSVTEQGISVVQPDGELDETTSAEFSEAVSELMDQGHHLIVIDLGKTTAASSHAFRSLLMLSKRLASVGGRLVVCAAQRNVAGALSLSGLSRLCCVRASRKQAVSELMVEERIDRLAVLVARLLRRGAERRQAEETG
jgi:anti-sigma B factor antagonist/stage II sporulation protein AA (anti-sigma F factor antagonist)